jgi:cellulose biosynthesis protein BcsQ
MAGICRGDGSWVQCDRMAAGKRKVLLADADNGGELTTKVGIRYRKRVSRSEATSRQGVSSTRFSRRRETGT